MASVAFLILMFGAVVLACVAEYYHSVLVYLAPHLACVAAFLIKSAAEGVVDWLAFGVFAALLAFLQICAVLKGRDRRR